MKGYIKPICRNGLEQWLAWLEIDGKQVWSATRWSEEQARAEAVRAAGKFKH